MFNKIFLVIVSYFLFLNSSVFASTAPTINCVWLPWCKDTSITNPTPATQLDNNVWLVFVDSIISNLIQFVAVFAVFALIISWFMYLLSSWDEEKTKKAKKWIIWSLVAVILSVSAWSIINYLNNIQIW